MKRFSWLVAAFALALAGLVSESKAVRPLQHIAPVYSPGSGGQRGDDDAPDKEQHSVVPRARQVGVRLAPTQLEFEKRSVSGNRVFFLDIITIRDWLRLQASRAIVKTP